MAKIGETSTQRKRRLEKARVKREEKKARLRLDKDAYHKMLSFEAESAVSHQRQLLQQKCQRLETHEQTAARCAQEKDSVSKTTSSETPDEQRLVSRLFLILIKAFIKK